MNYLTNYNVSRQSINERENVEFVLKFQNANLMWQRTENSRRPPAKFCLSKLMVKLIQLSNLSQIDFNEK